MPVIILEGIDGSGKSTLADEIIDMSPIPARYLHRGPLEGTVEEELIYPLQNIKPDELLVCDRWHVGEMIYGPIYRGKSQVQGVYHDIIENLLWDLNAVKVILSPDPGLIADRLDERGEDYLQPEHFDEIYQAYESYAFANDWRLISEIKESTAYDLLQLALEGM